MSFIDNYIKERSNDELFTKLWMELNPHVYNRVCDLLRNGIEKEKAEKIAISEFDKIIESTIDEELMKISVERMNEKAVYTLGEVIELFDLDVEEILRLVNEVEIE